MLSGRFRISLKLFPAISDCNGQVFRAELPKPPISLRGPPLEGTVSPASPPAPCPLGQERALCREGERHLMLAALLGSPARDKRLMSQASHTLWEGRSQPKDTFHLHRCKAATVPTQGFAFCDPMATCYKWKFAQPQVSRNGQKGF